MYKMVMKPSISEAIFYQRSIEGTVNFPFLDFFFSLQMFFGNLIIQTQMGLRNRQVNPVFVAPLS